MPLYDRARRGEPLKIRADQWNAIINLAEQAQRTEGAFGDANQLAPIRAANIVTIKNEASQTVPRFGVLAISGALHDPTNHPELEEEFVTKLTLRGIRATANSPAIVIALEPIAPQKFGRAAASGVFACRVDVCSVLHQFATAKANDLSTLQSAHTGPVQLLWKAGQGAARWAIAAM